MQKLLISEYKITKMEVLRVSSQEFILRNTN